MYLSILHHKRQFFSNLIHIWSCHSIAINKVMTQLMILESVNAGETKDVTISLEEYSAFCGIQKSEDIKNITLDFICTNIQDEILFSGDVQTFDFVFITKNIN